MGSFERWKISRGDFEEGGGGVVGMFLEVEKLLGENIFRWEGGG